MTAGVTKSRSAMFPARVGELRRINAFLEGFCAEAGVERERCLRLNLVLEELFVNTVQHGHRGDCDAPVWVGLEADAGGVHVTYEDTAPPFNPYARLEKAAETGLLVCRTPEPRPLPGRALALPWWEFPAWLNARLAESG